MITLTKPIGSAAIVMVDGYETLFDLDLNSDAIIGKPPIGDANADGLVDDVNWKYHRIFDLNNSSPYIKENKGKLLSIVPQS